MKDLRCLQVAGDSQAALAGPHICQLVNLPHPTQAGLFLLTLWLWFYPKGEINVRPPLVVILLVLAGGLNFAPSSALSSPHVGFTEAWVKRKQRAE